MSQDVGPPQGGPPSHDPRKSPSTQATDGSPAEASVAPTPAPQPSTAGTLETAVPAAPPDLARLPMSGAPEPPAPARRFVNVVSVKFPNVARPYQFNSGEEYFVPGEYCIVETERGDELGEVVQATRPSPHHCGVKGLKKVLRRAADTDREVWQRKRARENESYALCQLKIKERKLKMKLVRVQHSADEHRATVFFTADERVDFRDLVRELAQQMHSRVEMRQIGLRDESKIQGGCGPCGRVLCCSTWLREFQPVSIKMARAQGLGVNPGKLTGMCGRLKCCLRYEYDKFVLKGGDPAEFEHELDDHPGTACPGGACGNAPPPN